MTNAAPKCRDCGHYLYVNTDVDAARCADCRGIIPNLANGADDTAAQQRNQAQRHLTRLRADLEAYLDHLDDRMDDDSTLTHVSDVKASIRTILGDPD